jgi:hypothetical protein
VHNGKDVVRFALAYGKSHLWLASVANQPGSDAKKVDWTKVVEDCGGVVIDLGMTLLAAPTGVAILLGIKAFTQGVKCGMAISDAWSTAHGETPFYSQGAGKGVVKIVEVVDIGLTLTDAAMVGRRIHRINTMLGKFEVSRNLERLRNLRFFEGAELMVVHLPGFAIKTGNLLHGRSANPATLPHVLETNNVPPPLPGASLLPPAGDAPMFDLLQGIVPSFDPFCSEVRF